MTSAIFSDLFMYLTAMLLSASLRRTLQVPVHYRATHSSSLPVQPVQPYTKITHQKGRLFLNLNYREGYKIISPLRVISTEPGGRYSLRQTFAREKPAGQLY